MEHYRRAAVRQGIGETDSVYGAKAEHGRRGSIGEAGILAGDGKRVSAEEVTLVCGDRQRGQEHVEALDQQLEIPILQTVIYIVQQEIRWLKRCVVPSDGF